MANTEPDTLSRDDAFDILSNRRRRYALYYLSSHHDGITLQQLSREIAAWENGVPVESLNKKQQKRVYVSLYQTHIPKLESIGVVEYDDESGEITLTRRADAVTTYLRADQQGDTQWYRYYLGLVGLSFGVFLLTVLDVGPFGLLSLTLLALGIILAFALLTLSYFLSEYRKIGGSGEDDLLL
jgi:hypothetical protein